MIENNNKEMDLPASWVQTTLGDIINIRNGYAFKSSDYQTEGILLLRQGNLGEGKVSLNKAVYLPKEYFTKYRDFVVRKGDVVIGMSGSIGKLCVYDLENPALQNQRTGLVEVLEPNTRHFVRYYFSTLERRFSAKSKGVGIQNISAKDIGACPCPLPPLPEQKQIVDKIEELFTKLDAGIEALKKVRQELKRYRQAVLKHAFEGKLTNVSVEKDGVPKGWQRKKMGELTSFSQGIQVPVQNQFEEKGNGCVRFLRIIDFTQGNQKPRYIKNPGGRYCVAKDDLSMVRYGATTGFICTALEGVIANNLFRIIPVGSLDKRFLFYFIKSHSFSTVLKSSLKGAAMPAISFGLLKEINFLLPLYCEQQQIVLEIERHFSIADQIEQTVEQGLKQADRLRQSILKRAFEGKLVPQNPEDEPADKLLERIKAEKEKLKAEQKRKSRKELDNVKKGKRKDRRSEAM